MARDVASETASQQLLHLVFGGELRSLDAQDFRDLAKVDIVGIFPNYASAYAAWRSKAQAASTMP